MMDIAYTNLTLTLSSTLYRPIVVVIAGSVSKKMNAAHTHFGPMLCYEARPITRL
jgi:hypothetical protein